MADKKFYLISYSFEIGQKTFDSMGVWKGSITSWIEKTDKKFTILNIEELTSEEYDFIVSLVG
jgi:hypothetical protein